MAIFLSSLAATNLCWILCCDALRPSVLLHQGIGSGLPLGRGRAPWEGQEQGRGMGQGRLFRVVGWDEQTGTHLLLSVPGVEEDTPWEQYLQVWGTRFCVIIGQHQGTRKFLFNIFHRNILSLGGISWLDISRRMQDRIYLQPQHHIRCTLIMKIITHTVTATPGCAGRNVLSDSFA